MVEGLKERDKRRDDPSVEGKGFFFTKKCRGMFFFW